MKLNARQAITAIEFIILSICLTFAVFDNGFLKEQFLVQPTSHYYVAVIALCVAIYSSLFAFWYFVEIHQAKKTNKICPSIMSKIEF